jgi:hypothetical protein
MTHVFSFDLRGTQQKVAHLRFVHRSSLSQMRTEPFPNRAKTELAFA